MVPRNAISCQAFVTQASVWNTSPNIAVAFKNNTFTFTTTDPGNPGTFLFTFLDGLYSLNDIGTLISNELVNNGLPSNLFTFSGLAATSQTVVTFLRAGDSVDFSTVDTIGSILGYLPAIVTAPSSGYNAFSTNPAALNRNNGYLISSQTFLSSGIPVNNSAVGVLAVVPINVPPGSLINYAAQLPSFIPASELIGNSKTNFTFRLTNTSLGVTPTGGGRTTQFWSFVVDIEYELLISEESQRNIR
jgi:hypothetical protein